MNIFDTHCHLAADKIFSAHQEIFQQMSEKQVNGCCVVAITPNCFERINQLKLYCQNNYPNFKFASSAGLHPHNAKEFSDEFQEQIINQSKISHAIGECGLDFYYDFADKDEQLKAFNFQIELAKQTGKPLIIHCRNSIKEIIECLQNSNFKQSYAGGVLHCFTEDYQSAKILIDMGLMISFSGILTFKNSLMLKEVASKLPLDKILVETDSPYLSPVPMRGKTNNPSFVAYTIDCLADIREEARPQVLQQLWKNSLNFFGLK